MNPIYLPVAGDGLDGTIVTAEGNVESNDSVAGLDQVEVFLRNVCLGSCAVEEELDLLEEARLLELVELRTKVLGVDSGSSLGESSNLYSQFKVSNVSQ